MNQQQLIEIVKKARKENACLILKAGDYFTDYIKIIKPSSLDGFLMEALKYSTDIVEPDTDREWVKINSVDVDVCLSGELNQYCVFGAAIALEEDIQNIDMYLNIGL